MEEYYTEDQIQEIVGKAHCYLSIIGLKIIDDFTIKGSSYHEDSFYSIFDLLITIENRQAFDITNETFQQLVALLESKTYSTNGCCSPDTDYIFIYGNIQTFKILPLSFLQLTDTPKTYDGSAGLFVRVKSDESGLEFFNFINDFNPDGILTGLGMSIAGSNVLIAAGRWVISNTTYFTSGTTTLPIDAQDATLSRYDAVYAATDGLHIISGTLSATPVYPTIPNGTLLVGTVFITPTTVTTTPVVGSYVTTNTNQTGLSGNKNWTGKQTYAVAPTFQNTPTGTPSSILALDSSDNLIHISASTYVPYTGATGNVSLGNNGLIMTGSGAFIALHSDVQNIGVTSTTFTNLYTAQTYNSFEIHNAVGGLGSTDEYTSLQLNKLSFNNINSTFSQYLVPTSSSLSGNITNTMPSISGVLAVDSNIVHITGLETITGNKTFTGVTAFTPGIANTPTINITNSGGLFFYDATNTSTRFEQVGPNEFWINSSNSTTAIVVIKNGQLYNRDGGGIETPYLTTGGAIIPSNNLSDLTNFTIARSNIGLAWAGTSDNQYSLYPTNLGDSLTAGYGGSPGWVADLQTTLAPRGFVFNNTGIGGQTSTQIAVRCGAVATTATVVGGSIPASGGVTVTFPTGYEPVTSQGPIGGTYGSISGIPGLVTLSGATYTFTRTTAGSITSVSSAPFVVVPPNLSGPVTIWVGRNNFNNPTQVISDIDAIITALGTNTKYVIFTILNATSEPIGTANYTAIASLNSTIMSRYAGHAFDLQGYLVFITGADPTGIINVSYKSDDVHLNTLGYQLVANYVLTSVVWNVLTGSSQGGTINVNNFNQWFKYNPITGPSGITSFTGTVSLGLMLSGANGPTNYEGIDFVNSTSPTIPTVPYARIAAIAGTTGSVLSLGTTNNYASGVNNQALNIGPNGDVSIGGTVFLGSKFTVTPNTTSATNISRMVYGNPTALGATVGSYTYSDEEQNGNTVSGINRFQKAFYRRVAGSGFQGTEMRLQYAVDNSFTTGGLSYIGIGADTSGNGTIFAGSNGTDMWSIVSTGMNIPAPTLAVTSSAFTAKYLTIGSSGGTSTINFARPSDGATAGYVGYRKASTSTSGDFVVESDGGGSTLTLNAGATDIIKLTSTGVTLPLFTVAGIIANSAAGLLSSVTITGTGSVVQAISPTFTGAPLSTTAAFNTNTTQIATTAFVKGLNYLKTIFVPTTGNTVTLVAHNYNIINPAGTLAALTFVMPTSPVDGDILFVKFIQAVTTITWPAAVKDAVTTAAAASQVILIYDSSSTNWY